jgi:uridine phosphorylase
MDFFDPEKDTLVSSREMVKLFTLSRCGSEGDLSLPSLAVISFSPRMLEGLVRVLGGTKSEEWRGRNPSLFLAKVGQRPVVLTKSPVGAPGAAILLEDLAAFGVDCAIFLGYCGSINVDIGLGEIVLPTQALREEGTSYHYLPEAAECRPSRILVRRLERWLKRRGVAIRKGRIWTTDALYRETRQKILRYRSEGVLAVDMEVSALFAVGAAREVEVVAVLLVSDDFQGDVWRPGFFDPLLVERERSLVEVITTWLETEL